MAATVLAHAAVLVLSFFAMPTLSPDVPSLAPHEPDYDRYLVQSEPLPSFCTFPAPESQQACFDRATLRAAGECTLYPHCEEHQRIVGHDGGPDKAQAPVLLPVPTGLDEDGAEIRHSEEIAGCAAVAREAGFSGTGRVFVRVTRSEDGQALSQAIPRDESASVAGLLCCVRFAQGPYASTLSPGQTARYEIAFSPQGVETTLLSP